MFLIIYFDKIDREALVSVASMTTMSFDITFLRGYHQLIYQRLLSIFQSKSFLLTFWRSILLSLISFLVWLWPALIYHHQMVKSSNPTNRLSNAQFLSIKKVTSHLILYCSWQSFLEDYSLLQPCWILALVKLNLGEIDYY